MKKYIVTLSSEERATLESLTQKGTAAAYRRNHAQILLLSDMSELGPGWPDERISQAVGVTVRTVEHVRQRLVMEGLEAALERKRNPNSARKRVFDGEAEAHLIALACSQAPEGHTRWTLRLLADKVVELHIVQHADHVTVMRTLKKNELQPHRKQCWCIPPKQNGEFVAHMEDVLSVYHRRYNPNRPVVCMDETNRQMTIETRIPQPTVPGNPARYDFEYKRNGVAQLFLFFEPLAGKRSVSVRQRKRAVDWAEEVKELLDTRYPNAKQVVLVMDNLNTHDIGSLYEAFPPEEAKRLTDRLEIHHTPKHGSWLNVAESEISALSRQCLEQRIPDEESMRNLVQAWAKERNEKQVKVNWQFTTEEARVKLRKLYPQL